MNGGHANIESLQEDSFMVQALSLHKELVSPRIQPRNSIGGQPQAPVLINHALPQKSRKKSQKGHRRRSGQRVDTPTDAAAN